MPSIVILDSRPTVRNAFKEALRPELDVAVIGEGEPNPSGIARIRRFHDSPCASPSIAPSSRSICSHMAVSTAPGQTQFEVTRCAASA